MTSPMKKISGAAILLLLISILSGCSNLGTGVVLWPPEDSRWEPGDITTVKDESFLRSTYIVNLPDQRRLKEEIDQWRVRLFKKEKDAVAWAAGMGEWKDVYAECMYQGLPMRTEPTNTSERVYRFRDGDYMKVLGRGDSPVQVGNLEGYWYYVLADGGVEGYVFDYHLRVMKMTGGNTEVLNAKDTDDPVLDNLLAAPWRPQYFGEMSSRSQIDLETFRSDYGFFPDPAEKTLYLKVPGAELSETWTEIIPAGRNRYDFQGTSFRVTVNNDYFISVQYNDGTTEKFEGFVRLGRDINDIITAEQDRRTAVLEELINRGPTYGSRAYGELAILEDGTFSWTGKSSLISRGIISSSAGNGGNLEFDHFIDAIISGTNDGIIGFRFDSGEVARFLYAFEDDGLRLVYVPQNMITDKRVKSDQFIDPVRIFFTSLGPAESSEGVDLPER